jgi:YVTN family beta-propeller protein
LVDKQSKFLYVINNGGNDVSSYSINATSGVLTPAAQPTILTGTGPQYSTIDPSGTRLYVTNNVDNTVSIFMGVDTGVLAQIGAAKSIPLATSVANVAIDPANKFIYVVNSLTGPSTLYAFALNADGTFGAALNGGTTYPLGSSPMGIAIDPTGKILAVDNNFSGNVSVYPINADGTLGTVSVVNTVSPGSGPQFVTFYSAVSGQ